MELLELGRRRIAVVLYWSRRSSTINELAEVSSDVFIENCRVSLGRGEIQVSHHLGEDVHG